MPTRDGEDPVQITTEETRRVETIFIRRRQNSWTVGCIARIKRTAYTKASVHIYVQNHCIVYK